MARTSADLLKQSTFALFSGRGKTFTWLWTRAVEVKLNRTLQVSIQVHWNTSCADSCCYILRLVDFTGTFTSQDLFSLVLSPKSLVQAINSAQWNRKFHSNWSYTEAALSLDNNVLALNGTVDFTGMVNGICSAVRKEVGWCHCQSFHPRCIRAKGIHNKKKEHCFLKGWVVRPSL